MTLLPVHRSLVHQLRSLKKADVRPGIGRHRPQARRQQTTHDYGDHDVKTCCLIRNRAAVAPGIVQKVARCLPPMAYSPTARAHAAQSLRERILLPAVGSLIETSRRTAYRIENRNIIRVTLGDGRVFTLVDRLSQKFVQTDSRRCLIVPKFERLLLRSG
jgi:hypothetical protein